MSQTITSNSLTEFRRAMMNVAIFTFANDEHYQYKADQALTGIHIKNATSEDKEYQDKYPQVIISRDGMISALQPYISNQTEFNLETYEHSILKQRTTTAYFTIRAQEEIPLEYLADQLDAGLRFARRQLSYAGITLMTDPVISPTVHESEYWEVIVSASFSLQSKSDLTYEDEDLILGSLDIDLEGENDVHVEAQLDENDAIP